MTAVLVCPLIGCPTTIDDDAGPVAMLRHVEKQHSTEEVLATIASYRTFVQALSVRLEEETYNPRLLGRSDLAGELQALIHAWKREAQ